MRQAKHTPSLSPHPLRLLFKKQGRSECAGMNWLQDRGLISDNCVTVEDVAPQNVESVIGKTQSHDLYSAPPWATA